MPNIDDIVELSDSIQQQIVVLPKRCVAVRNRNASCKRCLDACPSNALTVEQNHLSIDYSACVACGACTSVCPMQALVALNPTSTDMKLLLGESIQQSDGIACIACARAATLGNANPSNYVQVSCLSRVDEITLLDALSLGATQIVFVDGNCKTCKYRHCDKTTQTALQSLETLFKACESTLPAKRVSAFPEEFCVQEDLAILGEDRRRFFTQFRSSAKDLSSKALSLGIQQNFGKQQSEKEKQLQLMQELRVDDSGVLPQFASSRQDTVLDALFALAEQNDCVESMMPFKTRLFGSISIDTEQCSGCMMCSVFCSTGALVKSSIEETEEQSFLEFSACKCTQCGLCQDACLKKCLTVSSKTCLEELFSFEPRVIAVPKKKKFSYFSKGFSK